MDYMEGDALERIYRINVFTEGDEWFAEDGEGRAISRSDLACALARLRVYCNALRNELDELRRQCYELEKDRDEWFGAWQDAYADNKELFDKNEELDAELERMIACNSDFERKLESAIGDIGTENERLRDRVRSWENCSEHLARDNERLGREKERLLDEVLCLSRCVMYLELQQYSYDEWDDEEDYV